MAIKLAKENGAFVFGVCNVVGSSISRETHAGAYTHAGPEIGVASTKAFTNHCFNNDRTSLSKSKGTLSHSDFHMYLQELDLIPSKKHWRLVI
jgi:glucosamine--fructose-6-phosphate aminotransferase (isomerizing)